MASTSTPGISLLAVYSPWHRRIDALKHGLVAALNQETSARAVSNTEVIMIYGNALRRWVAHHAVTAAKRRVTAWIGFAVLCFMIGAYVAYRLDTSSATTTTTTTTTTATVGSDTRSDTRSETRSGRETVTTSRQQRTNNNNNTGMGVWTWLFVLISAVVFSGWLYQSSALHVLQMSTPLKPDTRLVEDLAAASKSKETAFQTGTPPTCSVASNTRPVILPTSTGAFDPETNGSERLLTPTEAAAAATTPEVSASQIVIRSSELESLMSCIHEIGVTLRAGKRVSEELTQKLNRCDDLYTFVSPQPTPK